MGTRAQELVLPCLICNAPSREQRRSRGYYNWRCMNGHNWRQATPKQAAKNWNRRAEPCRRRLERRPVH